MNFDYNGEQRLLADSVRRFLARDYDFEMGLTGLVFPAEHGGFGGGAVDLMGIMEAFGEALVVEPYLPTLMGGLAVARSPLARSILPAVVEGKMKLAFA